MGSTMTTGPRAIGCVVYRTGGLAPRSRGAQPTVWGWAGAGPGSRAALAPLVLLERERPVAVGRAAVADPDRLVAGAGVHADDRAARVGRREGLLGLAAPAGWPAPALLVLVVVVRPRRRGRGRRRRRRRPAPGARDLLPLPHEDGNPVPLAGHRVEPLLAHRAGVRLDELLERQRQAAVAGAEQAHALDELLAAEDQLHLVLAPLVKRRGLHRDGERDRHQRHDDDDADHREPGRGGVVRGSWFVVRRIDVDAHRIVIHDPRTPVHGSSAAVRLQAPVAASAVKRFTATTPSRGCRRARSRRRPSARR